jgi:uncharacterized protein (DUF2141 family)
MQNSRILHEFRIQVEVRKLKKKRGLVAITIFQQRKETSTSESESFAK